MVTEASNVRVLLKYELMPENTGTSVTKFTHAIFLVLQNAFPQSWFVYESVDVNIKLMTCRGDSLPYHMIRLFGLFDPVMSERRSQYSNIILFHWN